MRIALIGATGYGGTEAMRLLSGRADCDLVWVGSSRLEGKTVAEALPQFYGNSIGSLTFSSMEDMAINDRTNANAIDVALLALPHGQARTLAPILLARGIRVIDFSGDYRLPEHDYVQWYRSNSEQFDDVLPVSELRFGESGIPVQSVYGLPEVFREEIASAHLVANPGCYATCAELALLPLVEAGVVDESRLLIDAKSGVSGAGKAPSIATHFVEVNESMRAYKVGVHQHTPEIEQVLTEARRRRRRQSEPALHVLLTTQLLPIKRGIYVTAYAPLTTSCTADRLQEMYVERYRNEPFVHVTAPGVMPEMRYVTGTNVCQIGVHLDERTQTALVVATIDNLGKGAAGQALQNLNLMYGISEEAGLTALPWV